MALSLFECGFAWNSVRRHVASLPLLKYVGAFKQLIYSAHDGFTCKGGSEKSKIKMLDGSSSHTYFTINRIFVKGNYYNE